MVVTYALLTLAVLALWLDGEGRASALRRHLWLALYAAALGAAVVAGIVQPLGLLWLAALAGALGLFVAGRRSSVRGTAAAAIVLLAAGLMSHRLPGFANPRVLDGVRFAADSLPYRLHLNFDKISLGLLLLAVAHRRLAAGREWRTLLARTAPLAAGLVALLMALSVASGYVRFDPKLPAVAWLWVWANLCACLAEEAFFRGFVQARLQQAWAGQRRGPAAALAVAAVLFGLAHAGGGPAYVALSTVAGLGYGWAYLRTGRIEASILTHFAVNAVHFFGFSYPALLPAA